MPVKSPFLWTVDSYESQNVVHFVTLPEKWGSDSLGNFTLLPREGIQGLSAQQWAWKEWVWYSSPAQSWSRHDTHSPCIHQLALSPLPIPSQEWASLSLSPAASMSPIYHVEWAWIGRACCCQLELRPMHHQHGWRLMASTYLLLSTWSIDRCALTRTIERKKSVSVHPARRTT